MQYPSIIIQWSGNTLEQSVKLQTCLAALPEIGHPGQALIRT